MTKEMSDEFPRLTKYVIVNKPVILDQIKEDQRIAIKRIMAIVDTQSLDPAVHGFIRKAVLDGINDLTRSYATVLDRVLAKIEPVEAGE